MKSILAIGNKRECFLLGSSFELFEPELREIYLYSKNPPAYKCIMTEEDFFSRTVVVD